MSIESHGQVFRSYDCSTCGAKSRCEIDAQICEAKHVLRNLLIKQAGQDMPALKGLGDVSKRIVATDHADEIRQRKARKVKPLRGANIPERKL